MVDNYYEQIAALVEGGVDLLLPETAFDTLVLRRRSCHREIRHRHRSSLAGDGLGHDFQRRSHAQAVQPSRRFGTRSITIIWSASGSTARWDPSNCDRISTSFSASRASTRVAIPTPGLPNALGGFDETPESMAKVLGALCRTRLAQHRRRLLRHNSAAHQSNRRGRHSSQTAQAAQGRQLHASLGHPAVCDSAREQLTMIGERTRTSPVARSSPSWCWPATSKRPCRWLVSKSTMVPTFLDVNMDEGMLDGVAANDSVLEPDRRRARDLPRADHG